MEIVHFNQRQLAARWNISEATLERWRSVGIGPRFLKLCGRVLYRQVDIEEFEESCLATSTSTKARSKRLTTV
ncbi:DNA-binding protein [Hydrogenophaga defluvii]|uniref:DNA-binding protein n=1 Tax=Hydrogenophaga defluvii TaxID=249410 RepID=A0ABW2S7B2_9BURK